MWTNHQGGIVRYFYDTEFIEDGKTIELISIGIVAEDGREYYAVNKLITWHRLLGNEFAWLRENVWKHLPVRKNHMTLDPFHDAVKYRSAMAREILEFMGIDPKSEELPEIELWADYGAYDHVVLCQLWGKMADLPEGMPYRTNDIMQYADSLNIKESEFPEQDMTTRHHALHDARHNLEVFRFLRSREKMGVAKIIREVGRLPG